ncbi:MAG: hypothetical protein ACLR2O_02650 [Coprococcus sp.]
MIQSVQENAERLYMPGVTYTEKSKGEIRVTEAVVHSGICPDSSWRVCD